MISQLENFDLENTEVTYHLKLRYEGVHMY
jgi:hypothetical protein